VGERAQQGAENDRRDRLGQVQAEDGHREDADEDGCELEVRRRPGPEQLMGTPMALLQRDELGGPRLHRDNSCSVRALTYFRGVDQLFLEWVHCPFSRSGVTV